MQVGRDAAFENPLFYLAAYGLRAEWVAWLITRGGLQDWENRPVAGADFGDEESRRVAERAFPRLRIDDRPVLR